MPSRKLQRRSRRCGLSPRTASTGACAYYATINGCWQLTERVRTLDEAGVANSFGVAIKHGKPCRRRTSGSPTSTRSPLATAGQHALATVRT